VPNIKELKDKILHEADESAYSIHPGGNKMCHDLNATYWWYGVTPRSEKEGTKPPYVCSGCSNHTYGQQYGEQIQYLVKLQTRIFTK
jgi:hypothetical protein